MPDFDALQVFTIGAVFGVITGVRLGCGMAWLLSGPLLRPWRAAARAYRGLWRDTVRYAENFAVRWDAQNPAGG